MSRDKTSKKAAATSKTVPVTVKETAVDPILDSLFASSSGPIAAPIRSAKPAVSIGKPGKKSSQREPSEETNEEELEALSSLENSEVDDEQDAPETRPRKRRRLSQEDDIEASYLNRLAREEQKETSARLKAKQHDILPLGKIANDDDGDDNDAASTASNELEDLSDVEPENDVPQHESVTKPAAEYEKTRRTVFLGNVSTMAIKSKTYRKQLEAHLKSVLDTDGKETIESIRFRSTAFDMDAGPKRAAFAKRELMDDTTKSTNAYVVFNTEAAARKVAKTLNGTLILDRHLHTDWLAHPTAIDHKRCVFVGNLNFVDLESNVDTNEAGEKEACRPKSKEPADAEEGLWRAFSKCGTIESVRVPRDKVTRVGKGFAYVQFSDEVGTEKALALDGKKFPPMLPRLLRVSRAKRVLKKDLKRKREDSESARGRRGAHRGSRRESGPGLQRKKLDGVVFEGYRASADKGMKFKQKGKKKGAAKPTGRSSKRAAAFKAGGGRKKRDAE